MPTVQQILDQVQLQYPNAFTNAQLIIWGNDILRQIWKWMNPENSIYSFDLIANQSIYNLPSNGQSLDKITVIDIATDSTLENFQEHYYKGLLNDSESPYFYDATAGLFGIYPVPTANITDGGRIFYGQKFTLMTDSDLTATPEVNEDYHSLIVNFICMKAAQAGSNPDVIMANNFAQSFNDNWDRLLFDWTRKKCKLPLKRRSNKWWG